MRISERRVAKTKVRASVDTAEPGALAWGPPPATHPLPMVSPRDSAMERLREKPIHSGRRSGTRDRIHVIPDPLSSWNSNANLIAAATESSVIKRIKKHLYCDYASCQNVS